MTNSTDKETKKTAPGSKSEAHTHSNKTEPHESTPKKGTSRTHHNNDHSHVKHSSGKSAETLADKFAQVKVEVRKKIKSFIHKIDKML